MSKSNDFDPDEDFYEEDEPLDDVLSAFKHGIKGVTSKPPWFEVTSAPASALLLSTASKVWPASISVEPAESGLIVVETRRVA